MPKIRLEMAVPSARAEEVIEILTASARTGKMGDGKIFISEIAEAVRIRSGERGESVL